MKIWKLGFLAIAAAALVAGCSSSNTGSDSGSTSEPGKPAGDKKMTIGIVFDSGGRGDKSFNDSAWAGIERATKEFGIEAKPIESKNEKDYATNQTALAEQGVDLVIAVGLNQAEALKEVAKQFKDQKFAIVDGSVESANVRCLKFKEEEGSFLVGYLAGLTSKTGKVGFVGGMKIPLIEKFEAGYAAGAKMANPNIEILPAKYTDNWDDSSKGKASAEILFGQGADIIFHAAGRAGLGVINAAKEKGMFAIGVDSNQDDLAPGNVLTSMIKRVDEAVYSTIKDVKEGKFASGDKIYDLSVNGVGISDMAHTKDKVPADAMAKIEDVRKKIIAGEIKVPSNLADYATFLESLKK